MMQQRGMNFMSSLEVTKSKEEHKKEIEYIRTKIHLAGRIGMDAELVFNSLLLAKYGEFETPFEAFVSSVEDVLE